MDDQDVPLMTGALFDGAGYSPPPRHRGRSRKSHPKAQELSLPLLRLRGGGGSPPHSVQGCTRQPRLGDEKNSPKLGHGGAFSYLGEDGGLSTQDQEGTEQQGIPAPRLRGGAGSFGKQTKKGAPSPALSAQSYRLGSGDLPTKTKSLKGSKGSHTPEETWGTYRATKSKVDSTGSYTPDNTWGSGDTAHRDNQRQAENTWTWESGVTAGNRASEALSNNGRKHNKQKGISKPPSQKREIRTTKGWETASEKRDDNIEQDQQRDDNNYGNDDNWNKTNDGDNRWGNEWNNTGDGGNGQQDSGWGVANHDSNDDQNGDNNDNWDITNEDGQSHQAPSRGNAPNRNGRWGEFDARIQHDTRGNEQSAGIGDTDAPPGSWDNGEAKVPKQQIPDKKPSAIEPSAMSLADRSKSPNGRGSRVTRPPSIAVRLPASKGPSPKAPSVTSLKSALKSPFRSWTPTKASPKLVNDEVIEKVGAIPGAWSPPLQKKEKTRTESRKRRAAELNAERAKAHAAESDIESQRTGNQQPKARTPLSVGNVTPISKPTTRTLPVFKSRDSQIHGKRPSTVAEEESRVADLTQDNGPTHEIQCPSPASYTHKICAPHYMDTIADPYAHFVFHYREMAVVSKMCNMRIVETKDELQSRLASLTKQELLELLVEERLAREEEMDEKLTWKTSPGHAGYEPNLDTANERLDAWDNNGADSGGNGGEETDHGANEWGGSGDSGGGVGNHNGGGDTWGDDYNDHSAETQAGPDWRNSNDTPPANVDWTDSNVQAHNDDTAMGGADGW